MDSLTHIKTTYGISDAACAGKMPIEIPNTDRKTLARLTYHLGFTRGVEVGVERAMYSETICQANPLMHLYCVDAWTAYKGYRDHVVQQKLDRFHRETIERMAPYHATIIKAFSMDAVKTFEDGSLDFIYIDGNHDIHSTINDIAEWSKKVRAGGIIAGHDYVRYRWPNRIHVVQAVNAWVDAEEVRPWFLLGTQAKHEGYFRDDARSWFWVHAPREIKRRGGLRKGFPHVKQ